MLDRILGAMLISVLASACSGQGPSDEVGWVPVEECAAEPAPAEGSTTPQSLGSHFLWVAERGGANHGVDGEVGGALPAVSASRLELASDGCAVTLDSFALDLQSANRKSEACGCAIHLSAAGPVVGSVLASSPSTLRVAFDAHLEAACPCEEGSRLESAELLEVVVDGEEAGGGVATTVRVALGDIALSDAVGASELTFSAWGEFAADDRDAPERRVDCW